MQHLALTVILEVMNIDIIYLVIIIGVILFSMTLHEAMHAFASYWLGDDTAKLQGRLTFNPIKHIDPFLTLLLPILLAISGLPIFGGAKPVPFNPHNLRFGEWGMAIVALAGPFTNFVIAFISFGIWVVLGMPNQDIIGQVLIGFISINLGFFVFNMIPIPPLDGSRALYILAPEFIRRGMEYIERFGIMIIFIILLITGSALGTFMVRAIGFFLDLFSYIFGI